MGKIRYTTPDGIEQLVDLNEFGGHITIGRTPDCAVYANSLSVSRSHAQVWMEDNQYHLLDLNSSNGTFLNGRKIEKAILTGGDLIKCGEFTMVFEDEAQDPYRSPSMVEEINADDAAIEDAGPSWEEMQIKEGEISRLNSLNAELKDNLVQMQERIQALEDEVSVARAQAAEDANMARASQEQELEAAQQDISALTAQNNQLTAQLQSLTSQNAQLANQSKDIGNQSSQLNTQIKDLNTQIKDLAAQNKDLNAQAKEAATQNKELAAQNKDLSAQLKDLSAQQQKIMSQLKERDDELDKMRRAPPVVDGILPAEELQLRLEMLSLKEELYRLRRSPSKNVS
jgi:pSer/pThr/pTyr-binding forkhead associated (FHA) protein